MNDKPTFLSLFAGIGGFDLGLERAGWQSGGQVEVDPFCTRVLARHWPATARWGDINRVAPADLPRPDLLCGGFPCQDLSRAGRRAGLAAPRSGLFFQLVRLARHLQPRWLLLENVPDLLSSNGGRDFAVVLAALGDAGYGVGWRVLDARGFGVAQRRQRVFLVGHLGAPCPYPVLFEPEGVRGDIAPGDGAPTDVAGTLGGVSPGGGWRVGADEAAAGHVVAGGPLGFNHLQDPVSVSDGSPSLTAGGGATLPMYYSHDYNQDRVYDPAGVAPAVCAQDSSGARQELTGAAVRRLTPTECERLMGLPDGHTCLCGVEPYSTWTCRCPDGPRYAACGNAVVTNVVEWLGRRLLAVSNDNGT